MIARIVTGVLLLVTAACVAAPGQIEGFYRFGHEVNTVCTGDPERCYWLVDTSAEVRQKLKQQVENLAPYTPVCVRLAAEVSEQKADGFGLDYDGSMRVLEMLGRCDQASAAISTRLEDLQHHRWILHSIGDVELSAYAQELGLDDGTPLAKVPALDFGEQGFVSGNTGCNQFHGQARVIDDSLILSQLATTMMMCAGFSAELELRLQLLYRNPLAITREGNVLILQAGEDRLRYELRDWVQ